METYAYVKRSRIELAELGITGYVIAAFNDGRALIVRPGVLYYGKANLPPKIEPELYPNYEAALNAIVQSKA